MSIEDKGDKPAALDWRPLGLHRYCIDGDILMMEMDGSEFTLSDCNAYLAAVEGHQARYGYHLILIDVSHGLSVKSEVRRRLVKWAASYNSLSAAAIIGASLATRALVALTVQAMRLFGQAPYNTEFFDGAKEGKEWLATERKALRQRIKPGGAV